MADLITTFSSRYGLEKGAALVGDAHVDHIKALLTANKLEVTTKRAAPISEQAQHRLSQALPHKPREAGPSQP